MTQPAPKPAARRAAKPLPPHLAAQIASDDIVVGTRIVPLPAREQAMLAYLRAELEAGRSWPTLAALAAQMDCKQKEAAAALEALRAAGKVQVLTWEPYNGVGKRVPRTLGLVPLTESERAAEASAQAGSARAGGAS